ncbi:PilZ domain-containing protein [bacterium]|nr:PilZ domain-containing protein [bacterium]
MPARSKEQRSDERKEVREVVELIPDQNRLLALSFDVSSSGVQFRTREPLRMWIRMSSLGEAFVREAELAWVRKEVDGSMIYGLRLID